jgi:hypothetical protein
MRCRSRRRRARESRRQRVRTEAGATKSRDHRQQDDGADHAPHKGDGGGPSRRKSGALTLEVAAYANPDTMASRIRALGRGAGVRAKSADGSHERQTDQSQPQRDQRAVVRGARASTHQCSSERMFEPERRGWQPRRRHRRTRRSTPAEVSELTATTASLAGRSAVGSVD